MIYAILLINKQAHTFFVSLHNITLDMKNLVLTLFLVFGCFQFSNAQLEGSMNSSRNINLRPASGTSFPSPRLGIPDRKQPEGLVKKEDKGISMLPEKKFISSSHIHDERLKDKFKKEGREPKILDEYKNDMDFGVFKTGAGKITIACRDHMMFDGDRVQILLNDKVIAENVLLETSFKTFTIELDEGFNKIEFIALNQGAAGPNTAELKVFDKDGSIMISNVWNLLTGVKAKAVIVYEK